MKRFFITIISAIVVNLAFAGPIGKGAAMQIADNFIKKRHPESTLQPVNNRRAMRDGSAEEEAYYYVFNLSDDNGFVIVSGNDNGPSILGYTDQGSFDPATMPDGLAFMLDLYEEQIKAMESSEETAQASQESYQGHGPRHSISLARNSICPIDSFFFYANSPYNAYCPIDSTGSHISSGCVPSALAQVMAYWQHPQKTPFIPGYTSGPYILDDIPASAIDWANIKRSYSFSNHSNTTDAQFAAIADLIYKIAVAVKTDFATGVGAPINGVVPSFVNYFNYSPEMQKAQVVDLGMNKAEDILYNELVHERPAIMGGMRYAIDPAGASGHMWVIDGYDQDDLFHINWGWNAHMNGYYRISAISPYHHEMVWNYMNGLYMIYNIKPFGVESEAFDSEFYTRRLRNISLTATYTAPRTMSVTVQNALSQQYTFDQGVNIYDMDGNFIETVQGESVTLAPDESATFVYDIDFSSYQPSSQYILRPVSRISGETKWEDDECYSLNSHVRVTVSSSKTAFYSLVQALTVNSIEREDHGPVYLGTPQYLKVNITNNTNEKFGRWINLYANGDLVQTRGGHIPANSTADLYFGYEPTTEGTNHLSIALARSAGAQVIGSYDLEVNPVKQYGPLTMQVIVDNLHEDNDTVICGSTFRAKIKVTNNSSIDYHDYLNFILRYSIQLSTAKPMVDIPAGESRTYDFVFNGLERNGNYKFTTYYKTNSNSGFTAGFEDIFKCSYYPGYSYWTADGTEHASAPKRIQFTVPEDAVAVSFMGNTVQPTGVVMNSNPNTLYYVIGPYYDYLNEGNVVRNLTANRIVVDESYPFYVPQDFTAKAISFKRNFENGFGQDGTNWSTIVLPFAPDKVTDTQTGKEIDWYRRSSEIGKDFWLREFYAEDGNILYFKDAEDFKPYRPYIIAVPDNTFGDEFDLTDRDLEFSATNVLIKKSYKAIADAYNYNFEGTITGKSCEGLNCYILNEGDGGNAFVYTPQAPDLAPYHAMFTSLITPTPDGTSGPLRIAHYKGNDNGQTGINNTTAERNGTPYGVFTIDGRKIAIGNEPVQDILQRLPKGLYIINGRKYVK